MDTQHLLSFTKRIALETGELLRDKWANAELVLTSKGFRDIVTDADIASQTLLTNRILEQFPTHGFISEEDDGSLPTEGDVIWIIDPVDGTSNFSRKSPLFSVSIAAARPTNDPAVIDPFLGAIYDPVRDELFLAAEGQGATLNGRPISVSGVDSLAGAILAHDWPREPAIRQNTLDIISDSIHQIKTMRSIGSAALGLAYVACGRLDGYFNLSLQPWDVAAGMVILAEAGGRFSDLQNQPWRTNNKISFGSNQLIHRAFIELVSQQA